LSEAARLESRTREADRARSDANAARTATGVAQGQANLLGGPAADLDKLAVFLKRYDTRSVRIEGYTDNVGTDESNISLSQRRAASVQSYLVNQGVGSSRMTTSGQGENKPVSSNDSNTGRQQNRRVEVVISNTDL